MDIFRPFFWSCLQGTAFLKFHLTSKANKLMVDIITLETASRNE